MDKVCLEDVKEVEKKLQALVEEKLFGPPGAWLSDCDATRQKFVDWGLEYIDADGIRCESDLCWEVDGQFYLLFLGLYGDVPSGLWDFGFCSSDEDEAKLLAQCVENGEVSVGQQVLQRLYREVWPEMRVYLVRQRSIVVQHVLSEYREKFGVLRASEAA